MTTERVVFLVELEFGAIDRGKCQTDYQLSDLVMTLEVAFKPCADNYWYCFINGWPAPQGLAPYEDIACETLLALCEPQLWDYVRRHLPSLEVRSEPSHHRPQPYRVLQQLA